MHVLTSDGSSTLYSEKHGECYHSRHGAVQESLHVFIEMGLKALGERSEALRVFEMGFGTGLNALLTALETEGQVVSYLGIEAEPVLQESLPQLNYPRHLEAAGAEELFTALHQAAWDKPVSIRQGFTLHKVKGRLQEFDPSDNPGFDLVYFDAFAPTSQPELWTEEIFNKIYQWCRPGAILTTYSAKGAVRRAMLAAGFGVEKLPGPPGKREMLRAHKA